MNISLHDNCIFCNEPNLDISLIIKHKKIQNLACHFTDKYYKCYNCKKILEVSLSFKESNITEIVCIIKDNKDIICGQSLYLEDNKFFTRKFLEDVFTEEKEVFIEELTEDIAINRLKDHYTNILFT